MSTVIWFLTMTSLLIQAGFVSIASIPVLGTVTFIWLCVISVVYALVAIMFFFVPQSTYKFRLAYSRASFFKLSCFAFLSIVVAVLAAHAGFYIIVPIEMGFLYMAASSKLGINTTTNKILKELEEVKKAINL